MARYLSPQFLSYNLWHRLWGHASIVCSFGRVIGRKWFCAWSLYEL